MMVAKKNDNNSMVTSGGQSSIGKHLDNYVNRQYAIDTAATVLYSDVW